MTHTQTIPNLLVIDKEWANAGLMSNLNLTLNGKWFDMILSGEKKEEYRSIKPFWEARLRLCKGNKMSISKWVEYWDKEYSIDRFYDTYCFIIFKTITFTHGYAKNARKMIVECKGIEIGTARPEWSDNWQGDVFIIKLGEILQTENL